MTQIYQLGEQVKLHFVIDIIVANGTIQMGEGF